MWKRLKKLFSSDRKSRVCDFIHNLFGFYPKDKELFLAAFRHKSLYEGLDQNNERLEYLGDTVWDAVVADYLFKKFPDKNEGDLTKMKARAVSRGFLNELAHSYGITDLVESQIEGDAISTSIGGNAFEAVIAAVYLEKGFDFSREVISQKFLQNHLNSKFFEDELFSSKSKLIEICQTAEYKLKFDTNPVGKRNKREYFEAVVLINGEETSRAQGTSKKKAEKSAAALAIRTKFQNN